MSFSNSDINALLIIEILGRPPKHLVETLKNMIEEMSKEKDIEIVSKDIKQPVLVKDSKDFYTTFAEIEVKVNEISRLAYLMFKYMPAHLEIISPENIYLTNNNFNEVFNEVLRRLHAYDEIARVLQVENQKLAIRLRELEGKSKGKNIPKEENFQKEKSSKKSKKSPKK
ncbi:hypothetical protein FJZ20_01975 [Candidatus Pacearchaeota archaeon]|nr:hypothetical protein [Candidatus Pacearchaeota archaeon]